MTVYGVITASPTVPNGTYTDDVLGTVHF
jgi:spore coat protein U-like protein